MQAEKANKEETARIKRLLEIRKDQLKKAKEEIAELESQLAKIS